MGVMEGLIDKAFPASIGERCFASEAEALDWLAGAQGSEQDDEEKALIWKAGQANKSTSDLSAGATHPGFWARLG